MKNTQMNTTDKAVIIAGASGLVGTEVLKELLEDESVGRVYALTRKDLPFFHSKFEQLKDEQLAIHNWETDKPLPTFGFICLGTTRKQAGSKENLAKIDYDLVCQVAKDMKANGVKHLAVVSSLGASPHSPSHYLRTKGKMEATLSRLGFTSVLFARPGPLKGLRDNPRADEAILQAIMRVIRPFMRGSLAKYAPIRASMVAKAMTHTLLEANEDSIYFIDSVEMRRQAEELSN